MSEKPPWRQAIEQFERTIGAPLEEFLQTDEFADLAARTAKGQANLQRQVETASSQWLRALGVASAADVAELRREISELREELRALRESPPPAPKKTVSRSRPAPKKTASTAAPSKRASAAPRRRPPAKAREKSA